MAINKRGEGAALSENNIARRGRWLLWHYGKYNYKAALDPTDETVTSHARLGETDFRSHRWATGVIEFSAILPT